MNGLLIINKPRGWTSHDVVAKLRSILSQQKVGHTGTLDPDATGVLCVCIGKATKLASFTSESEKEYRVVMKLGEVTDTQDATGRVLKETKDFNITSSEIEEAFKKFSGGIKQIPPMYSAVKVGGVPLYRLARKGKEILREPREVFIKDIKLLEYSGIFVKFDVLCSKGTYIRTLCEDIGNYLGVGAHMYSLERIRSGDFSINDALTIEEVEGLKKSNMLKMRLVSMDQMLAWMPSVMIKGSSDSMVMHGRGVTGEGINEIKGDFYKDSHVRILDSGGVLLAIGIALCDSKKISQSLKERVLKVKKVLL